MSDKKIKLQPEEPEYPFKDPNERDNPIVPEPTIPERSPEEPNPYPVTDPIPEPVPVPPVPTPPEPIPKFPPDVVF